MAKGKRNSRLIPTKADVVLKRRLAKFDSQVALHKASGVSIKKIADVENGIGASMTILNKLAPHLGFPDGRWLDKNNLLCETECKGNCSWLGDLPTFEGIGKEKIENAIRSALQTAIHVFLTAMQEGQSVIATVRVTAADVIEFFPAFLNGDLQYLGIYEIDFNIPFKMAGMFLLWMEAAQFEAVHVEREYPLDLLKSSRIFKAESISRERMLASLTRAKTFSCTIRNYARIIQLHVNRLPTVGNRWILSSTLTPSDLHGAERFLHYKGEASPASRSSEPSRQVEATKLPYRN